MDVLLDALRAPWGAAAVCAAVASAAGFAAGVWFLKSRSTAPSESQESAGWESEDEFIVERALFASQQLEGLVKGMVKEVGEHATQIEAIAGDLRTRQLDSAEDVDDEVLGALGRSVDANTDLQKWLEQAKRQIQKQAAEIRTHESKARTDPLTGLANRRAFDGEIQREWAEWQRLQTFFSLILVDIDHFKNFNDTHGHLAGDEVMRRIGALLAGASREMDIVCRYGGEEFAVILPNTPLESACSVAERMRTEVEAADILFEGKSLRVTISLGAAQVRVEETDVEQLIKRADNALYRSKEAGRNCGHWHDGGECHWITRDSKRADAPYAPAVCPPSDDVAWCLCHTGSSFLAQFQRSVAESHRFGIPLSVVCLQVDGFDQARWQTGGEAETELALDGAARSLQSTLRDMDLVARLPDGRFVVMLPGSTKDDAVFVADRLSRNLFQSDIFLGDEASQLELRVGIAEVTPNDTAQSLVERAQQAGVTSARSQRPTVA